MTPGPIWGHHPDDAQDAIDKRIVPMEIYPQVVNRAQEDLTIV